MLVREANSYRHVLVVKPEAEVIVPPPQGTEWGREIGKEEIEDLEAETPL